MGEKMDEIILLVNSFATDIIVPLRRKIINEAAFVQLYSTLDEVCELIEHETKIHRDLAASLFLIYSQLITQSNYVYDKSPFVPYIGKMQTYIRKIFGNALQNA